MVTAALPSRHFRVLRLLMLLLGIVSVPSVGVAAWQRPHCAQHELGAQHQGHEAPAWSPQHDHGCPHCPATECARVSPCAGSTTTALAPVRAVAADLYAHRVAVARDRQQARSAITPPDTPPPQPIA